MINAITEMLEYKEVCLYKSTKDYEVYELKHICLVNKNKYEIEYNTQVIKNLYQSNNLSRENLIQLYSCKKTIKGYSIKTIAFFYFTMQKKK